MRAERESDKLKKRLCLIILGKNGISGVTGWGLYVDGLVHEDDDYYVEGNWK